MHDVRVCGRDGVGEFSRRVAARLRILAAERNVSRAEVSRRAGLSQTMGNQIFRGARSPTLDQLQAIAHVLSVPLIDLLLGKRGSA